ncbi:RCC1 domain-containing protein [Flavobacterium flavipallidum]|uniref:LamG-like jellyroll fold domain-containing protein n=1 Tax=Flavobacterium flavipallidum TaxID=3139140 RepID=A0ABU9HLG7_9FLAO
MRRILLLLIIFSNLHIKAQCWKTISAGVNHSVALKSDNTIWAWGSNFNGQLGDGTTVTKNKPTQINTTNNWQIVVAGDFHTAAIKNDGTLWAWGDFGYREFEVSSSIDKTIPTQIGTDSNWESVSAGGYHTVAIKTDGTLWAWGDNTYGQLGDGTKLNKTIPIQIGTANNWKTISAGKYHTIAIKTDGTLWAWGINSAGQLGDDTFTDRYKPTQIGTNNNWKTISTKNHTVAIKTDGTLWGWGANYYGQLGISTNTNKNTPTQIGSTNNWQTIAAGDYHTVAIKTDGTLWTCGQNYYGELGDNTNIDKNVFTPIDTMTKCKIATAGNSFTLAIKTDNTLFAWGSNNTGKLGDATNTNKKVPTAIACPESLTVTTSQTNEACTGLGKASITSVTGGTTPYSYLWSNGAKTNTITNLKSGDYSCTIKDADSLSVTKYFTITETGQLSLTTSITNTCNNSNTGSMTITATGGSGPYQYRIYTDYNISPGYTSGYQTSNKFSNLPAGKYYIELIDNNACMIVNYGPEIKNITPPPTVNPQSFYINATIADIQINGDNIKWYKNLTDVNSLATSTLLETAQYYASQTINGCESARTAVAITVNLPSEQIPSYVPTNDLIAYYPFNGNANDESSYKFKSITTNVTLSTDRFNNNNAAYSFNGTNSSIESNISNYPKEIKSYTVTGWFKIGTPQLSKEYDFSFLNFGQIAFNDWLKISFYLKGYLNAKFGSENYQSTENYFTNNWTFLAVTFNYDTNTFALYINNQYKLGGILNAAKQIISPSLRIGKTQSNNNYFEGSIDDIGIWNRVLSSQEISDLYNSYDQLFTRIPDINFEKKLIALGIDSGTPDGKVLTDSISSVENLDVSSAAISNLTGIENFSALKNLFCMFNNLSSLDLSKNIALRTLNCAHNKLSNLDLSKNINLGSLTCYSNTLTNLNLSENVTLSSLLCSSNQLKNLDLTKNISLSNLKCDSNQLTILDVSKNTNLIRVDCSNNQLESLNLKNGNNQKFDLANLASSFKNNPNLSCIQVDNKAYSDQNWSNIKDATTTYSENCPPKNILISSEFEDKLIALGIDKDGKNGSVLSATILNTTILDLSNSGISDLSGIEYFVNLEKLICSGNSITSLNLTNNTLLKYLDCSNNPLSALDVSKNTLLEELYIDGPTVVTNKTITAKNNTITGFVKLDLTNNLQLKKLSCSNNQIVSLDLSKNKLLTFINCSNNDLQSLNLKNGFNTNLVTINFKNNASLYCIQVDNVLYADTNWSTGKDSKTQYAEDCNAPLTLASNNFTIESKGETCLNENNGAINITAKANYNYVANINGTDYTLTNNSLTVANLAPATYTIRITIPGQYFEQNFSVTIPKAATITGKSTVSSRLASVEITEGTAPYTVFVNGKEQFETSSDTFSVAVADGDFLEVKTAKACEGIYLKEIADAQASIVAHPNPTKGEFTIEVPVSLKNINVDLYTTDSKIISSETKSVTNGQIKFNIENQPVGIYYVKIYLKTPKYLKIIKK